MKKEKKCIVYGCTNKSTEGSFIGDLCAPCHQYITTGKIGPTTSFLRKIKNCDMGSFPNFPEDEICPVCKTNKNEECVLIPIIGTENDGICQAQPIHLKCAIAECYDKETGILYTVVK